MKREIWFVLLVTLLAGLLTGCPAAYNQPPLAIATASPTAGEAPLAVSFDGSASTDPDGTISKYEWDFGDGSPTASGATVTHTFTAEGVFQVILTVTDNGGQKGTDKVFITVLKASIYFTSDRASLVGLYNIFRMDTDGKNQARVTDDLLGNALFPSLLYNTRLKLAFASDRDDPTTGTFDIFKSNVDGTLPVNLTLTTQTPYNEIEPSWSPDGSKIAFASDRTGNWEIFIMNADGSSVTQLTTQTASIDVAPAISPDGTKIAFVSDRSSDRAIWEMDIDGTNQTKLVDSSGEDGALGPDLGPSGLGITASNVGFGLSTPSWSPAGTKLAFASDRNGSVDIYVYDFATGTAMAQSGACDSGYDEFGPFWLPDGKWIAYVADSNADGKYEIWKVNVTTGAKLKLADIGNNVTPANKP